ncbi:hypothetical protein CDD83_2126 [Cordyceps sp. RAO-2017]|nr:hypothetical protein CDD83_2126 [Cordyceps sp. RAO-2017]
MSAQPLAPPHRQARVLACVLCQHRKIKCDRNFPCANCLKANVTCTPSTPAPARKRRRPNQDLQERLSRCEELLKQYAADSDPPPSQGPAPQAPVAIAVKPEPPDRTSPESQPSSWDPGCRMVNEEGGARFMDSYVWANIREEFQAMRDIVETEDSEDASILDSDDLTPENNADLFFSPSLASVARLEDLQPEPIHNFKLWQIFLDRVNPLTKIIHVPTVQPWVIDAATGIANVPFQRQALLFSIYTMAVISLSDTECIQALDMARETAIQKFLAGTKSALMRFDFLKNYDTSALQALIFYLYSLQGRYDRHALWILSGTVVRIAQKMGFHRDGEQLDLDPFEIEMRRRVWWQIVIIDCRHAMQSGLRQSMLPPRWDTKMPQNVNDADLLPGATEPIQPREGPTEMAFCIMFNAIFKFKLETDDTNDIAAFEAHLLGHDADSTDPSVAGRETAANRFRSHVREFEKKLIELENKYIDVNAGNVHKAALSVRAIATGRLDERLAPAREQPEWGTQILGPKDMLFKVVLMNEEQRMTAYEMMVQTGFAWFARHHFQLDIFAVLTGHLSQHPTGSLSDRAWAVVERAHEQHGDLFDMSHKPWLTQAQFTLRAWRMREKAFMEAGRVLETPQFIRRLRQLVLSTVEARSSFSSSATPPMPSLPQAKAQLAPPPRQLQPQLAALPPHQPQGGAMDPYFGSFPDIQSFDWDLFGNVVASNGDEFSPATAFGGLGLGNLPGMGPAPNGGNTGAF